MLDEAAAYAGERPRVDPARRAQAAVTFDGVCAEMLGSPVLHDVDLAIPADALTVVLGAVGLTKGAMIELVLGRRVPDAGAVAVHGVSVRDLDEEDLLGRAQEVGVVLRDGGLFSSMSIYDNVAVLLRNELALPAAEIDGRVAPQLEALGLTHVAHCLPGEIGPGQRKRAGLARALAMGPRTVLFDEPEANLDGERAALFLELIVALHARRATERSDRTWVLFTSDFGLVRAVAQHVVLMRRGRMLAAGTPADLARSENPYVRALLAPPNPGTIGPTGS